MYNIGDLVVYRQLTVCKIEGIETPTFEKQGKQYYKIRPVFDNKNETTIFVPTAAEDGLRNLFDKEEAERALREFPKMTAVVFALKKPPQLTAHYQELLLSCDLKKHLSLLKEIALKEKGGTKKLSEVDVRFRAKTEKLLCEELALVLGESPSSIKIKLEKGLY